MAFCVKKMKGFEFYLGHVCWGVGVGGGLVGVGLGLLRFAGGINVASKYHTIPYVCLPAVSA